MSEETEAEFAERQKLSEAIDQADAMRDLMARPGWELLANVIREDAERLTEKALEPIQDVKIHLAAEHEKGAAYYARRILKMPQTLLEAAEDIIEAAQQRAKENTDGEEENQS